MKGTTVNKLQLYWTILLLFYFHCEQTILIYLLNMSLDHQLLLVVGLYLGIVPLFTLDNAHLTPPYPSLSPPCHMTIRAWLFLFSQSRKCLHQKTENLQSNLKRLFMMKF